MTREAAERKSLRVNRRVLTPRDIGVILSDYADGVPMGALAKRFGVPHVVVSEIVKGAGWAR